MLTLEFQAGTPQLSGGWLKTRKVGLIARDTAGEEVSVDVPPTWAPNDGGSVMELSVSKNGMSATATPKASGESIVTISVVHEDRSVSTYSTTVSVMGEGEDLQVVWSPLTP